MIKPVTFQGCFNFNANLYALEVRSRFIDQSKANGYYKGYGNELAAQIVGQKIQIGTGAFLVQGRMCEITAAETVSPQIFDGFVGYVVARIETYHPSDDANCSLLAVVNRTFSAISLEQGDTYAVDADNINTAYELPIYSFEISGTQIVNLKKLITPVADYATIKTIVDEALGKAASAVAAANTAISTANAANTKSDDAVAKATNAAQKATNAVSVANAANTKSDNAVATANGLDGQIKSANATAASAVETANTAKAAAEQATSDVADLETQIVEKQGTKVTLNGEVQSTYPADDLVHKGDLDNASVAIYAATAAESEKAVGYTRGGEIDAEFKKIKTRLAALEGGN